MSVNQLRIVGVIAWFFIIFLTGFSLSRGGKPYNGLLFNFHKLIGLGALIALIVTASQVHKAAHLESLEIAAVVVTVILFVITIVGGGLTSLTTPLPAVVKLIHKVFPYLTALSSATALYLLLR